jgi:uncharacterized protein with GYD domain
MADTHFMLMRLSGNHDAQIEKLRSDVRDGCQNNGGQLLSLHATLGRYEAVALVELDSAAMLGLVSEVGAHVSDMVVLRAFGEEATARAQEQWVAAEPDTGHRG